MKRRKASVSASLIKIVPGVLILGVTAAIILIGFASHNPKNGAFSLPDKVVSQSEVQFCSPYANMCFTRPADWKRSNILHVSGTSDSTIEINPPTGTILEFAKPGANTAVNCDKTVYKACLVKVAKSTPLQNDLSVVTGMLIDTPDANCSDQCPVPKFAPFVALISKDDVQKYKLANDTATFDTFNPTANLSGGRSIYLQVTPGKEFSAASADQWQHGAEAKTAQQILASVQPYTGNIPQ